MRPHSAPKRAHFTCAARCEACALGATAPRRAHYACAAGARASPISSSSSTPCSPALARQCATCCCKRTICVWRRTRSACCQRCANDMRCAASALAAARTSRVAMFLFGSFLMARTRVAAGRHGPRRRRASARGAAQPHAHYRRSGMHARTLRQAVLRLVQVVLLSHSGACTAGPTCRRPKQNAPAGSGGMFSGGGGS